MTSPKSESLSIKTATRNQPNQRHRRGEGEAPAALPMEGATRAPVIEQGHLYLADMNPPRKSKPGKIRPVLVLQSSDILKAGSPSVVVIPLTTQVQEENILRTRLQPHPELKIKKASDILIDQIHTLDRSLLLEDLGKIPILVFQKVQEGVRFLLNL